jgi:glycosyltransferase involved in cell wall biosynthesis
MKPGVLMVTGAYWPELSGGGLQCRTMIAALQDRFDFHVLTTCVDATLPVTGSIEGVPVTRIPIDVSSVWSKVAAAVSTVRFMLRSAGRYQIVHLHGFSQKSILIAALSWLLGKRIVITIHTAGQDDPNGVRRHGALAYWAYQKADRFIAISQLMADEYRAAALPEHKLRIAPNGIDTDRFRPASPEERRGSRASIGASPDVPWILFVGFFSRDKHPDTLYQAWLQLREEYGINTVLLFVGATESAYYEVNAGLKATLLADAKARGVEPWLRFAGEVRDVERYYQAADVFVMPSTREAFGMALIEGMSSAVPVIATRITGVTDGIVDEGRTGLLVPGGDPQAIASALRHLLTQREASAAMGIAARAAVEQRFGLAASRERWAGIYQELLQR